MIAEAPMFVIARSASDEAIPGMQDESKYSPLTSVLSREG